MENVRHDVKKQFNDVAQVYDKQREKLIPCFKDFYTIATALAELENDCPKVIDLGAGTGLFSSYILNKYPKAQLTLIDLSEGMLEIAKKRFHNHDDIKYIVSDYTKYEYQERYDLVISSLSIHHLTDSEKKDLYHKVYSIMNNNSIFINADQVLGNTDFLDSLYKSDWENYIEHSGLDRNEITAARERTKLDKMTTLELQLKWLKDAGFSDVDCMYKYYNFVVMYARK
ncbi:class I SAM-dependent methyltransferase [Paenibacillus albiflavus]|uniref:Class I SAM-dependent methyltransferase n=1 Tax=Paenibacillus albiflavus TaxID=2545760 RepID=A0A4R4EGT5_9BACL|nr:class I SAM-dependent methyltransferase [Paenibacillus albiflavus]TCZ79304.1 class I SAM-dependent methyltransferase [Paenibacillus albiflavus]